MRVAVMTGESHAPRIVGAGKSQRFALAVDIPAFERKSIWDQFRLWFRTVRQLARAEGIEESDIEEIVREEYAHHEDIVRRRAFSEGRLSWLPVNRVQLRRVA